MALSTTNNVLEGISFEVFQGLVELMPKRTEAVTQHLSSLIFFFNLSVCFSLEHLSLMLFIPPPLSHWVQTCFIFFLFSQIHQPVLLAVCPQASLNESWVLGTADWLVGVYAIIIEMILRQFWLCGRSDFMPYRCKHSESQVNSKLAFAWLEGCEVNTAYCYCSIFMLVWVCRWMSSFAKTIKEIYLLNCVY